MGPVVAAVMSWRRTGSWRSGRSSRIRSGSPAPVVEKPGESIQFQFETFIFKLNVAIERIAQQIEELQDEQNEDNMFLNF